MNPVQPRVVAALVLLLTPATIRAEPIPDLILHETTSLAGPWKVIIDPFETGFYDYRWQQRDRQPNPSRAETFFLDQGPQNPSERVEYDFDAAGTLDVPGDWNTQRPELRYYEGTLWYRKRFSVATVDPLRRTFVRFGAANYRADVYLNGQRLGTHIGGFTPFSFEITGQLRTGENALVVRVDNKRSADGVPTLNTDWWNYGGLTRDVHLVTTPATFIAEHRLWVSHETPGTIQATVLVDPPRFGEEVTLTIEALGISQTVSTHLDGSAAFMIEDADPQLWSPDNPKLYEVKLTHAGTTIRDRVGFRTIATRGKQILLNGEPTFLRGICIHDELARDGRGRTRSPEDARQLLTWAKELGCNYVRLAHYPHPEYTTRLADELGLLVWSEVPVYWTIQWENPETYANAEQQLTEMIRRDWNRCSIIIWSLANETPIGDARTNFLSRLAKRARGLDTNRLLSMAMEKHGKPGAPGVSIIGDPLVDVVDVISFNQYVGWYDGLPDKCQQVQWEIPYDMPVIISEFGGGAKHGLHGDKGQRWTEEYQEDLFRQSLPMLQRIEGLAGLSPWILADFRSPRRVLPKIQDGFNRKGLVSETGAKKKAFFVMQEFYQKLADAE